MDEEFDLASLEEKLAAAREAHQNYLRLQRELRYQGLPEEELKLASRTLADNYDKEKDAGALAAAQAEKNGYTLLGASQFRENRPDKLVYNFNVPGISGEPTLKIYPDGEVEIIGKANSLRTGIGSLPAPVVRRPERLEFSPFDAMRSSIFRVGREVTWPETVYKDFWAYLNGEKNGPSPVQKNIFGTEWGNGPLNELGLALENNVLRKWRRYGERLLDGEARRRGRYGARNWSFNRFGVPGFQSYNPDPSMVLDADTIGSNGNFTKEDAAKELERTSSIANYVNNRVTNSYIKPKESPKGTPSRRTETKKYKLKGGK